MNSWQFKFTYYYMLLLFFSFSSLSKYLCANIGKIQIVDGGHRSSFGQRIQMLWIFGQQAFCLIDAITIARVWSGIFAFGQHSMNVTKNRIVPNILVVAAFSNNFLFTFLVCLVASVGASTDGVLVANGVHVVDVILHGQIWRWIDEKCEYCQTAQNQNGDVQGEVFVRQIREAKCVDENVAGNECPKYVQNEKRFEKKEPGETVNGTIWCWGWCVLCHGNHVYMLPVEFGDALDDFCTWINWILFEVVILGRWPKLVQCLCA